MNRLERFLYRYPYSVSYFGIAYCIVFVAWDLYTHWWIAAAGIGAAGLMNVWVIWYYKRRARRTDEAIKAFEQALRRELGRQATRD